MRVTKIGVPKPRRRRKVQATLKKGRRIKPNRKRQKRLFEENFGGKAYHDFIVSLPCDVCGVEGHSEAAHLTARGAGGKAEDTAPLCGVRFVEDGFVFPEAPLLQISGRVYVGCHHRYDAHDPEIRKHEPRLRKLAAERWQSHSQIRKST